MEPRPLQLLAANCAGRIVRGRPDTLVRRVTLDSRRVEPGDLFVAVKGEQHEGHDYLLDAARRGATALLVEQAKTPAAWPDTAVVTVADTRAALGQIAAAYRQEFGLPIVAIAGSNGKTTTKELLAAVLSRRWPTLASDASFNNDIGVPLTLLRLERAHRVAVVEAGTNHPGELPSLLRLIRPTLGVLTSLGREHLAFFGSLSGVIEEEGWVGECLPSEGSLFINGDCPGSEQVARRTRAATVRAGFQPANDWRVTFARVDDEGTRFGVQGPRPDFAGEYRLPLFGRHQAFNGLLALAVAAQLGLDCAEARAGLLACRPPKMRLQLWNANGLRILDDSYNANADSMCAALDTLRDLPCAGRRIAALGDMAELGDHSAPAHAEVARYAVEAGVAHLFAIGQMAGVYGRTARDAGAPDVREFDRPADAAQALADFVRPGDLVLVKASRATHLEGVVEELKQRFATCSIT